MPTPKKVPVEVALRANALTKQYTIARPTSAQSPAAKKKQKVIAALKKLHPMD